MTALFFTVLIETVVLVYLTAKKRRLFKVIYVGVAINLFTNPLANICFSLINGINVYLLLVIIEIIVIILETFLLQLTLRFKLKEAVMVSLFINIPTGALSLIFI